MTQTFLGQAFSHLRQDHNWGDVAQAAIGGYAAAMFIWEVQHPRALAEFLMKNAMPLESRRELFLILLVGSATGLLLWLATGWILASRQKTTPGLALDLAARGLCVLTLLPFLPLLAVADLEMQQPFICFGLIVAMSTLAYWAVHSISLCLERAPWLDRGPSWRIARAGLPVIVLFTLAYVLLMSVVSILRHNGFMTHAFDLGIQNQVVYNILHAGRMTTTLLGATERLYDHFSPLFYVIAPVYALFQDARTLLVLQSVFLGGGAIPLYLLTKDKTSSAALAFALATSYLLYPALHGVNLGDFHQIAFVSGLQLLALYFLERGRNRLFLIAQVLALFAKEEMALSVAAVGVYILLTKRQRRLGLALTAFGILYFVIVVGWLMPQLGSMESAQWRYASFVIPGKGILQSFLLNFVTNPMYPFIYVLSNPDKVVYLAQLFLPVLFLPVFAPLRAWSIVLPAILLSLLTVPEADYGIRFHHSAHVTPFIFFLAALALQKLKPRRLKPTALAAGIIVASLAMSYEYGQLISKQGIPLPHASAHIALIRSFFEGIPRQASLSTQSDLVPHLSARSKIYLFPIVADADYLLFDSHVDANFWPRSGLKARSEAIRDALVIATDGQFGLIRQQDGILLFQRGYSTAGNTDAVRTLLSARYEAEKMSGNTGAPADDPQASGDAARVATPGPPHIEGQAALVYGPYTDLPPSKYRVEYALKTDRTDRTERVATVDVFTFRDGGVPRAAREILGTEFAAPDRYQLFELEFESDKPLEDVEFRVQYAGLGTLWLDYVSITPIELWLK